MDLSIKVNLINLDDNRDIYHDLYKIMNDSYEDSSNKKMNKIYSN